MHHPSRTARKVPSATAPSAADACVLAFAPLAVTVGKACHCERFVVGV
jgi:hypothetical protein